MSLFLIRAITWNHVVPPTLKESHAAHSQDTSQLKTLNNYIRSVDNAGYVTEIQMPIQGFTLQTISSSMGVFKKQAGCPVTSDNSDCSSTRPFRSLTASSHTSWSSVSQKRALLWDWAPRSHNFFGIELDSVSIVAKLAPRSVAYITRYEYATIYNFCTCWGCWDC